MENHSIKETNVNKNIYQKMQRIRHELGTKNLKKTGENKYSNYNYYELGDFLPFINELMDREQLFSMITFEKENAKLTIIDSENPNSTITFYSPMAEAEIKGAHKIQNIGAIETYQRRYLYLMAFEISESDIVETSERKQEEEKEEEVPLVDEIKIKVMKDKAEKKGVSIEKIIETYHVEKMEDLTVLDFNGIMELLNRYPDKQEQTKLDL